jgi:hypothetical protein
MAGRRKDPEYDLDIPQHGYQLLDSLGSGSYGKVYTCERIIDKKLLAIKIAKI